MEAAATVEASSISLLQIRWLQGSRTGGGPPRRLSRGVPGSATAWQMFLERGRMFPPAFPMFPLAFPFHFRNECSRNMERWHVPRSLLLSSNADPGVGKLGQPDDTNQKREVVHEDGGGFKSDTVGNNKNDNSTDGTGGGRDETVQQTNNKGSQATESSQAKGFFLQDPLIMECDPSHRCVIEKDKFIACLKVPGEDSLALSLLMDNKGTNPLDVSIKAPDYVTLAENTVHVEANSHNETQVSVSISDAGNNTAIVLKVAEENCTINIHSAIARERETGPAMRMRLTSTNMLVPVLILVAVVGICIKLRARGTQDGGLAYQKLDTTTELPVSIGGKKGADHRSDKWDDNWGDDWDDEEAPLTPSKPLANPSSVGLAARRSTKDGWKD